ncbi:MAG TPA: hypothetical protein VKA27_07950, partial [Sunxiuqinia sp.]|nr:hypothetical protein [Sunxiuqinia sp.]
MKYSIFGKNIDFNIEEVPALKSSLEELLQFYSPAVGEPDLFVEFCSKSFDATIQYSNPRIHGETGNGFVISGSHGKFAFIRKSGSAIVKVYLYPSFFSNGILHRIIANGEYSSITDKLSAILFENILIPAMSFFDDVALIHSAGISTNEGKALLLGGTGGIGKTSMEIEMCYYG